MADADDAIKDGRRDLVKSRGTSSVNPSGAEFGIFWDKCVNTIAADTLAPWLAKSSETIWSRGFMKRVLI